MDDASNPHPSPYALDQLAASGGALPAHVEGCPECQAYLARVNASRQPPAWLGGVEQQRPRGPRWLWMGASMAAALALVVGLLLARMPGAGPERPDRYVGAKGAPEVVLHVKREDRVWTWSPGAAVQPGDLLRLTVIPAGFSQLLVATPEGNGWTPLFQGAVDPKRETDIPASWRVDAAGESEDLLIVLSRRPVRPEELSAMAATEPRGDDTWTIHLRIEKGARP